MTEATLDFGSWESEEKNLSNTVPAGIYDLQLDKWEYRESKNKGTPGVNFVFKIVQNEDPTLNGRVVFHWAGWGTFFFRGCVMALFEDHLKELNSMDPDSKEYEDSKLKLNLVDVQNDLSEDLDNAIGNIVIAEVAVNVWKNEATGESGENNKISKFQQQS